MGQAWMEICMTQSLLNPWYSYDDDSMEDLNCLGSERLRKRKRA